MKKIGILSMHRVVNYGSFLQAYALKKIIENCGECQISFVDIRNGKSLYPIDNSKFGKVSRVFKYLIKGKLPLIIQIKKFKKILKNQFEKDFYPLLGNIVPPDSCSFDAVVIGSDEVFHCCQQTSWGFTTQLYGDIPNSKKIISYAASFGATQIENILAFNLSDEISLSLRKLDAISVRDDNSRSIVNQLINVSPDKHLDPVLVYGYKKEMDEYPDFNSEENFLLVYSYNGRISDKKEINCIKDFARKKSLKIYTIFCDYKWADKLILPKTPCEMLKVFQKSKYVVSDTFHGTIFSIITHNKFCTLMRQSSVNKITSMLDSLNLSTHIVNDFNMFDEILEQEIDYENVEKLLEYERIKTENYLKNNLFGENK